ncbi:DUF5685 family protein [Nocardiopsis sp. RSe5-2]|uniref:DUF5685 family protein n=1 Tax=Nocardiopsis endophytica TaxID=3018445 RepID=A0ABT4TXF6_9ACTN|nr:DUF5685 family protein [Nocardiopsis endophytica]MDA2809366.1 DUF5685 family protein [Nocardiopsis endophytica]
MFGILRPCRHSLPGGLAEEWMSHMCGLCLALRDDHGQASRIATNYDGLVVSVLTAAQAEECAGTRRAGACPLRGMRGADVADGSGARLAASVSLMLASAKISDHIADGDGVYARRGVRALAGRVAERWRRGAQESGDVLGFDGEGLLAVLDRQKRAEEEAGPGTDVLAVTWPTEEATGEAFAHTAQLAGRPGNAEPLREAGRLFGRIAHLLDAVEDRERDREQGAWNPLTATGTEPERARELCDGAVLGVRLALEEAEFADDRLVHALLVHELGRAVDRTFTEAGYPQDPNRHGHGYGHPHHDPRHRQHGQHPHRRADSGHSYGDHYATTGGSSDSSDGGGDKDGGNCCETCLSCGDTPPLNQPYRRGLFSGCAVAVFMFCTCQLCCRDPHPGPWSGKSRDAWCNLCECCECCKCCECCNL